MARECKYTRKFCRSLEAQGALTYPLVASEYAPPGWPDRIVEHLRWHGYIEFKDETTIIEPLQLRRMTDLQFVGAKVVVVRFFDEGTSIRVGYVAAEKLLGYTRKLRWSEFLDVVSEPFIYAEEELWQ